VLVVLVASSSMFIEAAFFAPDAPSVPALNAAIVDPLAVKSEIPPKTEYPPGVKTVRFLKVPPLPRGFVEIVLTPILPLLSILNASTPPSPNAMVSALGKKIPVLESPVGLMDGAAADQAATVVTPTTTKPPASILTPVLAVTKPTESTFVTSS